MLFSRMPNMVNHVTFLAPQENKKISYATINTAVTRISEVISVVRFETPSTMYARMYV
jgi:hypothetical protein